MVKRTRRSTSNVTGKRRAYRARIFAGGWAAREATSIHATAIVTDSAIRIRKSVILPDSSAPLPSAPPAIPQNRIPS